MALKEHKKIHVRDIEKKSKSKVKDSDRFEAIEKRLDKMEKYKA